MDQQVGYVHIIHKGEKLSPEDCRHPAAKQYSWFAEGIGGKILCSVCLQCNSVIAGGVDDDDDQEPEEDRLWICPVCKERSVKLVWTNEKEDKSRPAAWYACQKKCGYAGDGTTLPEKRQEPPDNRRWQCPACKKRTMRETKAPSGPMRANGQYNCTYCDYTCDGNKLLLAGMGGFRLIEGD